jgi:hypothetical protein
MRNSEPGHLEALCDTVQTMWMPPRIQPSDHPARCRFRHVLPIRDDEDCGCRDHDLSARARKTMKATIRRSRTANVFVMALVSLVSLVSLASLGVVAGPAYTCLVFMVMLVVRGVTTGPSPAIPPRQRPACVHWLLDRIVRVSPRALGAPAHICPWRLSRQSRQGVGVIFRMPRPGRCFAALEIFR